MKKILLFFAMLCVASSAYAIKITYGPYIQNVTETSFTVVWATDVDAVSWVELAPDDKEPFYAFERPKYFQTVLGRKCIGKLHAVTVPRLEKGTSYCYRAYSQEVVSNKGGKTLDGRVAATRIFGYRPLYIRTFDSEKPSVKCLVVNDIHSGTAMKDILLKKFTITPKGRNINGKERKADTKNRKVKQSYDIFFFNGGMATEAENKADRVFTDFLGIAGQTFADELPIYMVRGVSETWGDLGINYMKYFPSNSGLPYYIVRQGPVCFIVLDSGNDKADKDSGLDFENYRAEEALWLKEALESEEVKGAKYRVALMHIPPVAEASAVGKELKKLFVPMLEAAGVDVMLCGYTYEGVMHKAGEKAKFPILVNSSKTQLELEANAEKMEITVKEHGGLVVEKYTFTK
jgi:hypothetical protein